MSKAVRGVCGIAALLFLSASAGSAPPTLTHLHPVAGQQGSTVTVSAAGKFDPWPPQAWVSTPGVTFKPGEKAPVFEVEIAADAEPGPHLVRFYNAEGVSVPRFFIVSQEPQVIEAEPNNEFDAPQQIATLPAAITGRLDKSGDVDCFAVTLRKGQTLVASLDGFVLASSFDGMLRVLDEHGVQLAFNQDDRTFDPFLAWEAPHDGGFIVQVMGFAYPAASNVQFTGGENCVYRLHLHAGPFVRHTLPLVIERGTAAQLKLAGWNLSSCAVEINLPCAADGKAIAPLNLPGAEVVVGELSEMLEAEPNDSESAPQPIDTPGAVTGCIGRAGDEDRFLFNAVKDRTYSLEVTSPRIASPLDAWLKIEDTEGKELARNDDAAGSRNPRLTWKAPADGKFIAAMGEVTHRGGNDFVYRLAVVEATPSLAATAASHSASVAAGKTADFKVAVKRTNGFAAKLQLVARNLPPDVTAPDVDAPEKDGEVTLKIEAAAEAKLANHPFQLVLREVESGTEHPVIHSMTTVSENNGVPQGYSELVINSTDQLWLTVTSQPQKETK